jgi:uncharacterized protein
VNPIVQAFALLGVGAIAGLVGTAGGIMSLVSYPALLLVGIPPLPANVANIVAGVACWPGSAVASRPELDGRGRWLRQHLPLAAAGGAAGVALLLSTPPGVFTRVVPFLIAIGSIALLLQPYLPTPRAHHSDRHQLALSAALVAVSIYIGYFGAGSGVMLLAVLLVSTTGHVPTANALKNMLIGAASVISAATLIAVGTVDWTAAIPLGIGMFAGSLLGPRLTRWTPTHVLRPLVSVIGLGFALQLWLTRGS